VEAFPEGIEAYLMSHAITNEQAEHFLGLDDTELYTLLIPSESNKEFYSRGGKIARGKEMFRSLFGTVRATLCAEYGAHKDSSKNIVDLMVLIAGTLSKALHSEETAVFALSALIVKIGLAELCKPDAEQRPEE
jgi:hypothetical protein